MSNVTIKITLGHFSVEVDGPQEWAEGKVEALVEKYAQTKKAITSDARLELQESIGHKRGGKKRSIGEFLKKTANKNQPDRAMVFGYYLEKFDGFESFTTTEINKLGMDTKHPFGNISDVISRLVSRGLMMSTGDKDGQRSYVLTASGEELVESMVEQQP